VLALLSVVPPPVATVVVPTGLDVEQVNTLRARVDAQVAAAGGAPSALSTALEVKSECIADPSCAQALVRAGNASCLLFVEALSVVSLVLLPVEYNVLESSTSLGTDKELAEVLLPALVAGAAVGLVAGGGGVAMLVFGGD